MKTSFVLMAVLAALVGTTSAQDSIGCGVEGECLHSDNIGVSHAKSQRECLEICQKSLGCMYYTYFMDGACFLYTNCVEFDTEGCTDCFSGDKECHDFVIEPMCDIRGSCEGDFEGHTTAASNAECLEMCFATDGCNFYTYDKHDDFCSFYATCHMIDEGCTSCESGERDCFMNKK